MLMELSVFFIKRFNISFCFILDITTDGNNQLDEINSFIFPEQYGVLGRICDGKRHGSRLGTL